MWVRDTDALQALLHELVSMGANRPDSDVDFLVDLDSGRTIFDLAKFLGDLRDLLGTYIRDHVLAEAVGL
jgi:predicted nucleotidyltransferase